jgi:hypothetical protein
MLLEIVLSLTFRYGRPKPLRSFLKGVEEAMVVTSQKTMDESQEEASEGSPIL